VNPRDFKIGKIMNSFSMEVSRTSGSGRRARKRGTLKTAIKCWDAHMVERAGFFGHRTLSFQLPCKKKGRKEKKIQVFATTQV